MQASGVMFHHFHGAGHTASQGSIDAEALDALIDHVGATRFLPARDWLDRFTRGALDDHLCLSFDDGLRCQIDVARPVLDARGLTAFWFVPSAILDGVPHRLELYRHFRCTAFDTLDDFYRAFEERAARAQRGVALPELNRFVPERYLAEFPFYTNADRRFRFVRDEILGPDEYERVLDGMMVDRGYDLEACGRLWVDDDDLRSLTRDGHLIGLHSHTHPTRLGELPVDRQRHEYETNHDRLHRATGEAPVSMSHPCNSYTSDTHAILGALGIQVGFRSNTTPVGDHRYERPREDHANVIAQMRKVLG
ncbi:MAG: polysaccharide deacetylase family protein [Planctomycetes bacterium]|nr:polysaccharide deacetylase family protein [Planctomycetota bacterium]